MRCIWATQTWATCPHRRRRFSPTIRFIYESGLVMGANGFEQLGIDQQITSVAFALKAKSAEVAETVSGLPNDFVTEANLVAALREKLASLQSEIDSLESQVASIASNGGTINGSGVSVNSIASSDNGDGSFKLSFTMSDGSIKVVTTPDLTGPQGVSGADGSNGADGASGPKGDQGRAWSSRPTGASWSRRGIWAKG